MKIFLFAAAFIFSSLILLSCKKDNPVPPEQQPQVNLTLEDVSCTEAWIKLSTNNISIPTDVELQKDGILLKTINLNVPDTILYIDSLLPHKTYNFKSIIQSSNQSITSAALPVTTMDTTSHNFTWQTWTFGGQAGSCTLNDVAIIDENNIWAVGEIYLLDTLGQPDPYPYNLAVWNGISWELKKIKYQDIPPVIHSILVINENDIWLDPWFHWNGQEFQQLSIPSILMGVKVNKMWGNSEEIYVVGNNGFIAKRDVNGHWSKIEGGTDLNINDIYGAFNTKTEKYEILAPAANVLESLDRDLLKIDGDAVTHISTLPLEGTLSSLWFIPNRRYYICGGGIYQKKSLNDSLWGNGPFEFTQYYSYRIRGVGYNDIALTGGVGELLHYNGFGWQSYIEQTRLPYGNYYGLDFKDNVIIAVGENNPQAVITVGRRIN
jgi:hypothetical protein